MGKQKKLVRTSLLLALGIILPYVFHATGIPGQVFLPMHIPVLLSGFIVGFEYGLLLGLILPYINSLLTGMPPLYPTAISMSLELAAYGFASGYLYKKAKLNVLASLIISMILGRVVSGIANYLLLVSSGKAFVLKMFIMSSLIKPIWGIVIQIVLIPLIVNKLNSSLE